MTVCSKCGLELKKGAKFCKACGSGQQDARQKQDKKSRVLAAGEKKSNGKYVVLAIVALAVGAGLFFAATGKKSGPGAAGLSSGIEFTEVKADQGSVSIPVSAVQGEKASYFKYTAGGKEVKFFALRAPDGTIRVALDACQACYRAKLGYHQEGDTMVCNNCGIAFRSADIGIIRGGCNPIPVDHSTDSNVVVVKAKDLEGGVTYF